MIEQDDILTVKSKGCIVNIKNKDDMKLSQTTYDKQTLIMIESKPYSISPLQAIQTMDNVSIKQDLKNNCFIMENKFIYVKIQSNGIINSLIHKQTNKQVIKIDSNSDNYLKINHYFGMLKYIIYKNKNMKIIETGPLRCARYIYVVLNIK